MKTLTKIVLTSACIGGAATASIGGYKILSTVGPMAEYQQEHRTQAVIQADTNPQMATHYIDMKNNAVRNVDVGAYMLVGGLLVSIPILLLGYVKLHDRKMERAAGPRLTKEQRNYTLSKMEQR